MLFKWNTEATSISLSFRPGRKLHLRTSRMEDLTRILWLTISLSFTWSKKMLHRENTAYLPKKITREGLMRKSLLPRVYTPDILITNKSNDKSRSGPMSPRRECSKASQKTLKTRASVFRI